MQGQILLIVYMSTPSSSSREKMLDSVVGNREVEHGVEVQPTVDVCSVG